MNHQTLFDRLLKSDDESEVDSVLQEAGFFSDEPDVWQPFGNYENNFNLIGNQQADPTAALVEKLINGIDAVLMSAAFNRGIDPEGPDAPQSMAEAVERFFEVRHGRLENLMPAQQTELAENLHLIAVGSKKHPSYLIVDKGEGQTPLSFPDTFLSLNRSNKMRIPFVQGKFNSGGTGILQFCGTSNRNYELIVSRRHPDAPVDANDETKNLWGFTIVRRLLPSGGRKASSYVYLAPHGKVPSFQADAIKVLTSGPGGKPGKPYSRDLPYGTCVKLYNYRWKTRSIATTDARYELEHYLHAPCLPFRISESRDYKANYYGTTVAGVWATVNVDGGQEKRKVEEGFPADAELNLPDIGRLPYQIVLFREELDPRHFPHGVYFTVNGQVHGQLPINFISTQLKFDYLSDYLLISIDCTSMNPQVREDFFMASRDRLRRNEAYDEIYHQLKEELKSHPGLRTFNALRKQKDIEKALSDDKQTASFLQDLINRDPALAALFGLGSRLVTSSGPSEIPTFHGRKFPTFFKLGKEPKDGLVKQCPLNKTVHIEFETDAENNYFERADSPGEIAFNPPNLCVSNSLWNGKFSTRFQMPWDANIDDTVEVTVSVTDVEREKFGTSFTSRFVLKGTPEIERQTKPGTTRQDRSHETNGKASAPLLALPKPVEVRKADWDKPSLKFNEHSAIKITHDDEQGYIFYINVDNCYLITELTRVREEEKPLVKFWFMWGLILCSLGVIQEEERFLKVSAASNGEEEGEVDLAAVSRYCNGISRVIVPVVRQLYRGPGATTSALAAAATG